MMNNEVRTAARNVAPHLRTSRRETVLALTMLPFVRHAHAQPNGTARASDALTQPAAYSTMLTLTPALAPVALPPFAPSSYRHLPRAHLFRQAGRQAGRTVVVDRRDIDQPFFGVGAAITESVCALLSDCMTARQRTDFLKECFATNSFSMVRICIGDSDYVAGTTFHTYDDVAGDAALRDFSIERDRASIIPTLRDILSINPGVKIIASPWSPPAFLKTSGALTGADSSFWATSTNMETYARYLVRFVQEYGAAGVPVWAITVQNEPNFSPVHYPGCIWSPDDTATFIGCYLGPALAVAGLDTRILVGDASWRDTGDLVTTPLHDRSAAAYIFGAAYHGYFGSPTKQMQDMRAFPGKMILMTEVCQANDATIATEVVSMASDDCVATIRNGASAVVLWNLCTDAAGGPSPSTVCRGAVYIATDGSGKVTRNAGFHVLTHIGRFVRQGAKRCASTSFASGSGEAGIQTVAFANPGGETALFIFNNGPNETKVAITDASTRSCTRTTLHPGEMQTIVWS